MAVACLAPLPILLVTTLNLLMKPPNFAFTTPSKGPNLAGLGLEVALVNTLWQ